MNSMIIVAAGASRRMGGNNNKLLMKAGGLPLIWYTLQNVTKSEFLDEIILVVRPEEKSAFQEAAAFFSGKQPIIFADGGETRADSVWNGLQKMSPFAEKVLIHDGARPFVDAQMIDSVILHIDETHKGVLPGMPCVDTIKMMGTQGEIHFTPERSKLIRAQTPQGFLAEPFKMAMASARKENWNVTDDASVMEANGYPVFVISGKEEYFKVTTLEDWRRFIEMTEDVFPSVRIGQGYDVHRFSEERPMILGGVRISDTSGLEGHSDADVLIHALMDALLGAAGLADIGTWFPDTDPIYEGASSLVLLKKVCVMIRERGWEPGNADMTILAEKPKLAPYISQMKKCLANCMEIEIGQIGIKATTNEKMGAIGRGEGIAAMASVLLFRRKS